MSFEQFNFNQHINKAIQACGYTKPTPIQLQSIPHILDGKDIVASAQTGTGKTASFVLPALHRLASKKTSKNPSILILTPTRELADQICQSANRYGKFLRHKIVSLIGGVSYRQQIYNLSRAVDIIVATPGRLLDHLDNKRIDLSNIEMLVLDEADRMLDMGFMDDVREIVNLTPANRQTLLFTATLNNKLSKPINTFLKSPVHINLSVEKIMPAHIKQELYRADTVQHKNRILDHLLKEANIFKAIIFAATKIGADRLADQLRESGHAAAAIHGGLKQNVRTRLMSQLRQGKIQFMVATDVASRGIDINDISHIINFDLPKFPEEYIHRSGRTGRAGREGVAISLALPSDARALQSIERHTGKQIESIIIPGLEPKKPEKQAVSAFAKAKPKKRGFMSKRNNARNYHKRQAEN